MDIASKNKDNVLTRFVYYNIGLSNLRDDAGKQKPLFEKELAKHGMNIVSNGNDDQGKNVGTEMQDSYIIPKTGGIYPIAGLDDHDHTGGRKEFQICGRDVFVSGSGSFPCIGFTEDAVVKTKSPLKAPIYDANNQIIPGKFLYMIAYWPTPDSNSLNFRADLHRREECCTGTYFAYKDKIINYNNPKAMNMHSPSDAYPDCDALYACTLYPYSNSIVIRKLSRVSYTVWRRVGFWRRIFHEQ